MATVSDTRTTNWTASEVIAHFGDIPIARIHTKPAPGTATAANVIELHECHDRLCELIDGTLVEKTMGWKESFLAGWILTLLNNFVQEHNLGIVFGPDGMFLLEDGQVRIPDVAFISKARFVNQKLEPAAFWELGCDLAVEVISPSNTRREMERKLDDYFDAGVQLVWLVYPGAREVVAYTSPTDSVVLTTNNVIEGGTVLPGFSIPVSQIFAELNDKAD